MNISLKEWMKKVLTRLTNTRLDTLLKVTSGLSTTTYTLSNSLTDYDFIIVSAYSSYSNRWQMTIPVGEFLSSAGQNYHTALGTEYAVYALSISYISNTQIRVSSKGTGTNGINIAGVKLGGVLLKCSKIKAFSDFASLLFGGDVDECKSEKITESSCQEFNPHNDCLRFKDGSRRRKACKEHLVYFTDRSKPDMRRSGRHSELGMGVCTGATGYKYFASISVSQRIYRSDNRELYIHNPVHNVAISKRGCAA